MGGLGEIGRNCMALEIADEIAIVDVGILFPKLDMLGVDLVLPDLSFLRENAERIRTIVLTHGHEDHIGGLPYLLKELNGVDVFGTDLTLGILRSKLVEHHVEERAVLHVCADREVVDRGPYSFQFIPVAHSVPRGCALAFSTPAGTIVHSGDFKIDNTPVDNRRTDLTLLGDLGNKGVRLLLSDSTNAEVPGWIRSERTVGNALDRLFSEYREKRIISACFASHLHRIQQIAVAAVAHERKVVLLGRSMTGNVQTALDLGVIRLAPDSLIEASEIEAYDTAQICVICTGSQGEPLSALALMAAHEHKSIAVGSGDLVLFSSHPIPGNEADVHRVIDDLYRAGAEVVHSGVDSDIHVSGHGASEDLKTVLGVIRPEYFVPIHGEYRHLVRHSQLAEEMGIEPEKIFVAQDGDFVELSDRGGFLHEDAIPAGFFYIDGAGLGDVSQEVLRDRRVLSEEGAILIVVTIDARHGEIISGPEIITRGWVDDAEAEVLIKAARQQVIASIEAAAREGAVDWATMKRHVREAAGKFAWRSTKRRPMILPVVMEV